MSAAAPGIILAILSAGAVAGGLGGLLGIGGGVFLVPFLNLALHLPTTQPAAISLTTAAPTDGKGSDAERMAIPKAAKDAFGVEASDRAGLRVEGGKTLPARFGMKASVLPFLAEVEKVNKKVEAKEEGATKEKNDKKEEKKDE